MMRMPMFRNFIYFKDLSLDTLKDALGRHIAWRQTQVTGEYRAWHRCSPAEYREFVYSGPAEALARPVGFETSQPTSYMLCSGKYGDLYLFALAEFSRPSFTFLWRYNYPCPMGKGWSRGDLRATFLRSYQEEISGMTEIILVRDGTVTKRIFCDGNLDHKPYVRVEGELIENEAAIRYNRMRRRKLLLDEEMSIICDHFGCMNPRGGDFPSGIVETRILDFGQQKWERQPLSSEEWTKLVGIPPSWNMSVEEWAARRRAHNDQIEASKDDHAERWSRFRLWVEEQVAQASIGARPRIVMHEPHPIAMRRESDGSPYRMIMDESDIHFWNKYEKEFKSYLFGPTAISVTLLGVDSRGDAYLHVAYRTTRSKDQYTFKVSRNGASRMPMFLHGDRLSGLIGPYDPDRKKGFPDWLA